jgi:sugar lactone lactonase YvrE
VAAFHLAWGPDDRLYVAAPTLGSHDSIYRVSPEGDVDTLPVSFGRPQGIAFDRLGRLYVTEALAGRSGIYRLSLEDPVPEQVVAAGSAIGLAFDPAGGIVVASSEALYHLAVAI